MRRMKPKLPFQFEDVTEAAWALQDALGNNYGSAANDDVIRWSSDPRRAARDFVAKVQTLRRALESAQTRAKGAALPDMVGNVELKQRLNALVSAHGGWGAPGEPLPAARLGSVKASIMREARKLRYEGGDATIDRQKWRIDRLERIADNWARAARLDASHGGETEEAVSLAPVFQVGSEAWAEAAATARRDEGESDTDIAARRARAEAEQEARAKALRESHEREQARKYAEQAEREAEAAREASAVEEAIRRHNAPLRPIRNGAKRKYLIAVSSAKGETDTTGYLKREAFAIEGRVWWPLGVNRALENDGKGGYRAIKREWAISVLPVGLTVGAASNVKEADDMAKTLAPRFREEVENIDEMRSSAPHAVAPLARIVSEYNERKRVDAETEKRHAEQRAKAEAARAEAERAEAERKAERAEAERAEATERLRKQAEREQEKRALYEQGARDYAARTEAEHREQREHERKQREREREREREWTDRERRENRELARRGRRDKAADKATMTRSWDAVDNAKDLASWLEALERIDRQARADGGPGASASVLIDGLPLGLDVLVFALGGENEEVVQATFDEVAIQNPQFARVLRRAMVAQKGKVSAAMLASSLRRRATLAKQTGLALGPPEPVSQGVKAPKRRNLARNVAELGLRMLAMRKEPQRGPAYLPDSAPGASSERTDRKVRKKSEDMARKKKSETEKPAKPAKPAKEGRIGVSVRVGNLYRVVVGRELVDAEVIGRDEGGWIMRRLPFTTAARAWEEGRQLRGRRSTEELKQCACVFDKENGA